ncbi:undecaprenyl-diphosphate phosphatase, partial (plasmid) [Chromobacterium amazonense]|nr:undecaprenyl-diphosphate phosphatase [Chromobacterium amazonense]
MALLESFNQSLFLLINATPASAPFSIQLATFIARDV